LGVRASAGEIYLGHDAPSEKPGEAVTAFTILGKIFRYADRPYAFGLGIVAGLLGLEHVRQQPRMKCICEG
jgi:hypothetical protein